MSTLPTNPLKTITAFILLLLCSAVGFTQAPKDSFYFAKLNHPGTKMIPVHNGQYKVFTQKIGDGKIKLLLLHGGPGNGHEYFENFPAHLKKKGVTIYYFDQLGSYYSDNPLDSTVFTPAAFVEHVEDVRKGLGLDKFYLLGHSWGGLLAELYAQKYQHHLKGLILSHVPGDNFSNKEKLAAFNDSLMNAWDTKTRALPVFKAYPATVVDSVFNGQKLADTVLSKRLHAIVPKMLDSMMFRITYYNKNNALPEPLVREGKHQRAMKNPYLLKMQRIYRKPDYKAALLSLETKTLLLGSAQDYMFPQGYYDMQQAMTKAKVRVHITPSGSHFAMWDDTKDYFAALTKFLKDVEKGRF